MFLIDSYEVHTPNMSILSSLVKKLKNTLKVSAFLKTTFNILTNISKGTGLRLMHAKFEKNPMKTGRDIHV